MKILLLDPFHGGSHAQWAKGLQAHSGHQVTLLSLPGRHWKWRMYGAAVSFARQVRELRFSPDLIVTTDMLDVAAFRGLAGERGKLPVAVYFHENQLTYPWSPDDADQELKRDRHYGFTNYTSALAANAVLFNSEYHRSAFLRALPDFLKVFPDARELDTVDSIAAKSAVLPLGLDMSQLTPKPTSRKVPLIVWNHRWEYDKNPAGFLQLLESLKARGCQFELAVLGQSFGKQPGEFDRIKAQFDAQLVQWGYAESFATYVGWLQQAAVLPVTSNQDFFGISAVEAIACGAFPILPNRLAFPEHVPASLRTAALYDTHEQLVEKTVAALSAPNPPATAELIAHVNRYAWTNLKSEYDALFERIVDQTL